MTSRGLLLWLLLVCGLCAAVIGVTPHPALAAETDELQIEVAKKGLGKEVVITQGAREWFLMIEVTPENTVIVRQEKDHDKYLVDESETHDRPLAAVEVDAAIADYINSVKARAKKK
ncbi:MAG: hypothetical protein RI101_10665 [Nitrospira sp.]|jgi:hypothetical protein|nr:hypothetical protein [Nitrospira sp.]